MRPALLGACLMLWAGARIAQAEEKEVVLAVEPGFAFAKVGARTAWGGGGGADLQFGVTDAFYLRLTGAWSAHALPAGDKTMPGGLMTAWHAGAGITYAVDIVRLVPFFDLSIGALGMTQPPAEGKQNTIDFGIEIGIGAEYLVTRRLAIGFVVRYHAYLTNINDIPIYFYAGPRVAFHFGG